jgi:hypothetical protein
MYLDYIEIGTSDFDTLVQSTNLKGISIDPLSIYLDNLPNKNNNTKLSNEQIDNIANQLLLPYNTSNITVKL